MIKQKKNELGSGVVELLLALVIIVLIGVVGWMIYNNHHKSNTAATTVTTTTENTSDLSVTANSAKRFNYDGGPVNNINSGVAVDVTLTNPTSSTVSLTTKSFELQDAQDNVYQVLTNVPISELPSGYVTLSDQTLQPHQTVRGALFFEVDDDSLSSFTLLNGPHSYKVVTS